MTALARAHEALGDRQRAATLYRDLLQTPEANAELVVWAKLELASFALEAPEPARDDEVFQDLAAAATSASQLAPFAIHLEAHVYHSRGEQAAAAAKMAELRRRLATTELQPHAKNRLQRSLVLWPPTTP